MVSGSSALSSSSSSLSRRSTQLAAMSVSVVFVVYKFVIWRSRKRAKSTAERMQAIVEHGGPLVDVEDPETRDRVLRKAIHKASTWMTLSTKNAQPMIGQVGGASIHKKPLLTLAPDYVLKPVLTDHRGIREIAFYSAMDAVARARPSLSVYVHFLKENPKKPNVSVLDKIGELIDTLALALAMVLKDRVVVDSEAALKAAWKITRREAELLHTLHKLTPPYYGVVGQDHPAPDSRYGTTDDTHLLLHDLTKNFSRPCVMDLKMGTQTYEPDATPEKKQKEFGKYTQQPLFGFRIVGMRIYTPDHEDADKSGYRFFGKEFGRGLQTREQVKEAFKVFFSAGVGMSDACDNQHHKALLSTTPPSPRNMKRKGSNGDSSSSCHCHDEEIRVKSASDIFLQIRHIEKWFSENDALLFCASSLLLVYEGNISCSTPDVTNVKMIDFGRVRRNTPEGDPGYRHGLQTMKELLMEIIREEERRL